MQPNSTRKRYSSGEREQYLRLWRQSGLSQSAFCQQFSLSKKSLSTWALKSNLKRPKLLPVQVDSPTVKNEASGQPVAIPFSLSSPATSVDLSFPQVFVARLKSLQLKSLSTLFRSMNDAVDGQ